MGDYVAKNPWPDETRVAQTEPLAFADRQFSTGRGNRRTSYDWVVDRVHRDQDGLEDIDEATAFVLGHAEDVPVDCDLLIEHLNKKWRHKHAVVSRVACEEQVGAATRYHYYVEGGYLVEDINA